LPPAPPSAAGEAPDQSPGDEQADQPSEQE
jgi:hypothetical protein